MERTFRTDIVKGCHLLYAIHRATGQLIYLLLRGNNNVKALYFLFTIDT